MILFLFCGFFFFQAEDGIRDDLVTGVQTCALPICISGSAGMYNALLPQTVSSSATSGDIIRIQVNTEIGRASCRERV